MKLLDIINNTSYCSIGCIQSIEDIEVLKSYLLYNFDVITKFPKIIIAHTKTENISKDDFQRYNNIWQECFGDKCIIIERPNFGHTFGFTDLDNAVLNESQKLGFKYSCKSTNDILVTENVFNIDVDNNQFLYLQGHGYTGLDSYYKLDVNKAVESFKDNGYEYFFPQTNFYIITNSIDFLIDINKFNSLYDKCINDPEYKINKTQTEYKYVLCECVLRDCIYRNNLNCKHLLSIFSYKKLLQTIIDYRIHDSSHKNIMFSECGICHFHFKDADVIEI